MTEWPPDDLEHLGACPICRSAERSVQFGGLTDKAFRVAPGRWTLFRCTDCDAAYLDPRPNEASIGRAYEAYYTHRGLNLKALPSRRKGLKGQIRNAWLNARFGYRFATLLPPALVARALDPRSKVKEEFFVRHLPAPDRPGARLLDVGCGNGDYLAVARDCGYHAVGIEPDAEAVAIGRDAGLEVHQGMLPLRQVELEPFDRITFSHVLEHLHWPREALQQVFQMLRPGGSVWISQPNLQAGGLEHFGENWRGLEAPRHLTLFTPEGLKRLLTELGFVDVRQPAPDSVASYFYRHSLAMSLGLDPYAPENPPGWDACVKLADAADVRAVRDPDHGEILTVMATRPI